MRTKRRIYKEKLAERSAQRTTKNLACQTEGGESFGGFNETKANKITFALPGMNNQNDDNKQVTMVVFEGVNVTDQAEPRGSTYRMDTSKRIPTPYDNYGTGPLYTIKKFTLLSGVRIGSGVESGIKRKKLQRRHLLLTQGAMQEEAIPLRTIKIIWTRYLLMYEGNAVTLTTDGEYGLGEKQIPTKTNFRLTRQETCKK